MDISKKYNWLFSKFITKTEKPMTAQMNGHAFSLLDPITVIRVLKKFKLASDINGVHKGAATRLFHFSMNKTVFAVLNARLSAERTEKIYSWSANGRTR